METELLHRPAVFHLATPERGLRLVDVEGELEDGAVMRWSQVFKDAIKEDVTGIAVDLRGCPVIGPICVSVLLAASSTLRSRGGGGVALVTTPESPPDLRLPVLTAKELPSHTTATRALLSLRTDAK